MKFRGYLEGVEGLERPMQTFANKREVVVDWGIKVLRGLSKEQRERKGAGEGAGEGEKEVCIVIVEVQEVEVGRLYPKKAVEGEG
jgi:hypothetical protein